MTRSSLAALLSLPPQLLAGALPALADLDGSKSLGHVAAVAVDRVLAWPWRADRLAECAARLAAGERAPVIHLSRYWLHGQALYAVGDGLHRTVAARRAGRTRIRARIGGEAWCKPEQHRLDLAAGRLWREVQHPTFGRCLSLAMDRVDPEMAEVLLTVGVRELKG